MSLQMQARNKVEKVEGGYDLVDQGWHLAMFEGIGEIYESQHEIKRGPRAGEYPNMTHFKFGLIEEDAEVRSKFFDMDDPHADIVVKVQNALAGRVVGDDEDFDFGQYEGRKRIEVFVVHNTRTKGKNAGKVFADVMDARPRKEKKSPKPATDFPDDEDD